jgi:hypothetical protein
MSTPHARRWVVVIVSLVAAALACARAEVPIVPVTADFATREPPTATLTPLPATPTVKAPPTKTPHPPTATSAGPEGYPAQPTVEAPATSAPAEASPTTGSSEPTQPLPADTQAPATETPAPLPTDTPMPPTDTPVPTELPTIPPQVIEAVAIPANATFTQQLAITHEGGEMIGDPGYLIDGRTITWAALDGDHTAWVIDLGGSQNIAGVKLYAQKPRTNDTTTLLAIEASNDGANWQAVFAGSGDCGEPNCDVIPQMTFTNIGFNTVSARYLRLRSGPHRFGFAEISVAIAP